MIVLRGHPYEWEVLGPTAVTIGVFDGVHRGHQQVIANLVASSGDLDPAVLTFDPHPLAILAPERAPKMLTDIDQRLEQFQGLGVKVAGVLSFPDIRELTADVFCRRVLADILAVERVVIGADFRFGRDRGGDADFLVRVGPDLGFEVEVLDMVGAGEGVISSTRIRAALGSGQVEEAARMLARPYELKGTVVVGDRRGGQIGFPTANLAIASEIQIPADGVYAAWAVIGEDVFRSVINIGVRPTFAGKERRVEAHLLDWTGDLYGHPMALRFLSRIRDEMKFDGVAALVDQISADVEAANQIFEAANVGSVPHDTQV
ncbi:MAG TPA: bifunctional riboflavin kinase/FAD synthetase [Acidimicrobiia bacterium]|nr:bifunctional riboflavin kinase/FAD synthetase [Acidimicrobiia bacterium]